MAPIVHCVRHAQGYHNLSVANHSMPDPSLTPLGEEQCRQLRKDFPYHSSVQLLDYNGSLGMNVKALC